jgi:hypothetical protein
MAGKKLSKSTNRQWDIDRERVVGSAIALETTARMLYAAGNYALLLKIK